MIKAVFSSRSKNDKALVCFLIIIISLFRASVFAADSEKNAEEKILNTPIQITSQTDSVLDMAVSVDGRHIAYTSGKDKPTALWWGSADPAVTELPRRLASGSSIKSSPAISPDGRYVAYVSTDFDVKGDIFILDTEQENSQAIRLTGRKTEDGGPCFSSDGRYLYFHQAAGNSRIQPVVLDLREKESLPELINVGGDGMYCSISPDDEKLAFVSYRKDKSGDIWVLDMSQKKLQQITGGPAIDLFPQWADDNVTLYFSRIGSDTNYDSKLTPEDNSVICRIKTDTDRQPPFPVTPLNISSFKAYKAGSRIYFLSNMAGISNCWTIPEEGYFKSAKTSQLQLTIAETMANRIPYDPYLVLLAYINVIERFLDDQSISAGAALEVGNIYHQLGLKASALAAFEYISTRFEENLPETVLAQIKQIAISFSAAYEKASRESEKQSLISNTLSSLDRIYKDNSGAVAAEAKIESADLIFKSTNSLSELITALGWLDNIIADNTLDNSQKARALFLKAEIYGKTATSSKVSETYRSILINYPEQRKIGDSAVERILNILLADYADSDIDKKIIILNQTAEDNKITVPALAMGALNRIGDLFYQTDQLAPAKSAYQHVLDEYPVLTTQTAAARLSLAEILFQEERFREALDLYKNEIDLREPTDRIYQLARQSYIRKKVSEGEFLYRLGEIPSSRNTFKELIDYDDRIVEAHRGYIKCAAASGDIEDVLSSYRQRLASSPEDPIWLYCTGLSLTYLNDLITAEEAQKLIEKSIRLNGSVEYFHQTLGYVYEVQETVYGQSKRLESALLSYQKAYFLNDHEGNPENAANLELNLGNTYYLLGQYGKAFDFYDRRNKRDIPFSNPDTEIVFFKRFGECAFQVSDINSTITAYQTAIERIDVQIDPYSGSLAFDRLQRHIKDTIISPGLKNPDLTKLAEEIAEKLTQISIRVSDLTQKSSPPPSSAWQHYKNEMLLVLEDQGRANEKALRLAEKINKALLKKTGTAPISEPEQHLITLTKQIREALASPERLIELKAEIMDRLGLAYQENIQWEKAADTFEEVFSINRKIENFQNLSQNRRSVAYNTYQLAGTLSGERRTTLLKKASDDFKQVISLIEQYGIPKPPEKKKDALIGLSLEASLDSATATQAAKGFSKEQEVRLAETFISRIQLELGNLETSAIEIEKQLEKYPPNKNVAKKDRYGVSLLYHRAALIANARNEFSTAFDRFAVSAALSLELENSVSTATNIMNMAAVSKKMMDPKTGPALSDIRISQLKILDKKAILLLSKNADVLGPALLAEYHNSMGIFFSNIAASSVIEPETEVMVKKISMLQKAVSHFTRGLKLFENKNIRLTRKLLETEASLLLNMGVAAQMLGEADRAGEQFQKALAVSDAGVFPDVKWRAQIGLGRTQEALKTLETITLARAGCEPLEIIHAFGSLVVDEIQKNEFESAFNISERISELERFNRMASLLRPLKNQERSLFLNSFPRLVRIEELQEELSKAGEDKKTLIQDRIENETRLFKNQIGLNKENLPLLFKSIQNEETLKTAIILTGLSFKIEEIADQIAKININNLQNSQKTDPEFAELLDSYQSLVRNYKKRSQDAFFSRASSQKSDFITLMSPESFEAMDIMDMLSEDDAVVRIYPTGIKQTPYAAFFITSDSINALITDNPGQLKEKIKEDIDWTTPYIACENPFLLNFELLHPRALSGSHLVRCISHRKPFKRKLTAIPESTLTDGLSSKYEISRFDAAAEIDDENFWINFSTINTLLISGGPLAASSVPVESGDQENRFFAVYKDPNIRFRLEKLLSYTSNLSLSILSGASVDNGYLIGHLFSIYGCPGVIFVNDSAENSSLIKDMLISYAEKSGLDALQAALLSYTAETESADGGKARQPLKKPDVLFLGYRGMTSAESIKFAKDSFITYVKSGRSLFDNGDYVSALVMFENAVSVALEVDKYSKYLPDLYKFGRESAYRAGNLNTALQFSNDLADLMDDLSPNTKSHAEALLRLGLIYSKIDNYEKAIPVIESSVKIMSSLTPDDDLINAMTDLGIVLENATNYETALSRFKSAADLSSELKRSELLGAQYLNIGRVYDLRLNQYATAIANYEKALAIFTESGDVEKIAESKLNIGRCFRLLGNFSAADQYFKECLDLIKAEAPDLLMIKVKIIIEQANNAWFQGRYEEALRLQRECYTISKKEQFALMQVISLNTAGLIWWTLGDYENALLELEDALIQARKLNIRKDEIATTLNNLGLIHRDMGNYELALETFDKAIQIDLELQSKWGVAYDYRNKGLTYLQMNQPESAVPLFDQAYSISNSIGNRINAAKAMLGKGDALLALKDYDNAFKAYQISLDLSRSMLIRETEWRSLYGLARIRIDFNKDMETAEKLLRESIDVIEKLRSDIKIKQLKENFITNKLSVYVALVKLLADSGKPVQAFEMAERSRSRNFLDLLGNQQIGFADEAENRLFSKQALIRSEIEEYESLMVMSSDPEEKKTYSESIAKLRHDLDSVMLDMQLQNPQLASLVSVPPIDADNLIKKMEPGVALLSYYLLDNEIFCWILRSDTDTKNVSTGGTSAKTGLKLIRIPSEKSELEKRVLEYRRIIQNLEPYEKHSKELYDRLIGPVVQELTGITTLGIIPHGSLHYLSFGTLFDGKSFVVDQFALFYLPSAAVMEFTLDRRVPRPAAPPKVLAIGNPDLGDPLLDLPFAEQEVGSMQWNFPNITVLTREKATKKWVVENIDKFDIIHIASHGEFDPVNPLLSAIKLAGSKDKNFTKSDLDGNLDAGEIFGLKLYADMVFLSACQTGLGKISAGDDVIGLNRSFFFAGTHTIISSLWRVSDVSTAILIKSFYRRYLNRDKADSLRKAAQHVKTRYPHPGYWGAFTLVGDYY